MNVVGIFVMKAKFIQSNEEGPSVCFLEVYVTTKLVGLRLVYAINDLWSGSVLDKNLIY